MSTPDSESLELGVIGAALYEPQSVKEGLAAIEPDWLLSPRSRKILSFAQNEINEGRTPDVITVSAALGDSYRPIIKSMMNDALHYGTHFKHYAQMLKKRWVMSQLQSAAQLLVDGNEAGIDDLRSLFTLYDEVQTGKTDFLTSKDALLKLNEELDTKEDNSHALATGIGTLDHWLGGLRPGELIVVGARPGQGKTTLSINLVYQLVNAHKPCLYYSTEMRGDEVMARLVSMHGVNATSIRHRRLSQDEYRKIVDVSGRLSELNMIWLCDEPRPSLAAIEKGVARFKNARVCFVDYVTRCKLPNRDRHDLALTDFMAGLKNIARRHNITMIAASQLNRASARENRRPNLADLRDSGGIEQEADCVLLLSADPPDSDFYRLNVAKNRHGYTGGINLKFDRNFLRFEEIKKETEPREELKDEPSWS